MSSILKVATDIISIWEHGGRYTCHGNGAYGLIGFQFGNVTHLLDRYISLGGKLKHKPSWYAQELLIRAKHGSTHDEKIILELDNLAHTDMMKKAQHIEAENYMHDAITQQLQYYPFKMPLSQLIICDMGVNNGKWNKYVQVANTKLLTNKSEYDIIWEAQNVRIDAVKKAGEWHYKGLRHRYEWYQHLCKSNHHLTMKKFMPTIMVNGYSVNIGNQEIKTI